MPVFSDPFSYFANAEAERDAAQRQRRESRAPFATQPEEDSALNRVLGVGSTGLQWAGDVLDKFGGRQVRGLLGGKPRELLAGIPFSDAVGITNPDDRVSGEDLAKQWGWLEGEGTPGEFEMRDLVGPALEIGLDPTTYLLGGAGAINKFGKMAKRLNVLPPKASARMRGFGSVDEIAEAMRLPKADALTKAAEVGTDLNDLVGKTQGGLGGFRFPFGDKLFAPDIPFLSEPVLFGTGPKAQAFADWTGKWLDKAKYSGVGQRLSSLFSPPVNSKLGEQAQRTERALQGQKLARETATQSHLFDAIDPLAEAGVAGDDTLTEVRRYLGEHPNATFQDVAGRPFAPAGLSQTAFDAAQASARAAQGLGQSLLQSGQAVGLAVKPLKSIWPDLAHAPRMPVPEYLEGKRAFATGNPNAGRANAAFTGNQIQREEMFDIFPEGTTAINRTSRNPELAGISRKPLDAYGQPVPELTATSPLQQQAVRQIATAINQPITNIAQGRLIRQQIGRSVEDLLGARAGEITPLRPGVMSDLRILEEADLAGRLTNPTDLQRLAHLRDLRAERDHILKGLPQLRRESTHWKDPGYALVKSLNRARQDRAVAVALQRGELAAQGFDPNKLTAMKQRLTPFKKGSGPLRPLDMAEEVQYGQLKAQQRGSYQYGRFLGDLPDEVVKGRGLFGGDPLVDLQLSAQKSGQALHNTDVVQDILGKEAFYIKTPTHDMVPVRDIFEQLGLTGTRFHGPTGKSINVAQENLLNSLNASGALQGQKINDLKHVYVTPDIADQLLQYRQTSQLPSAFNDLMSYPAALSRATKTMMTAPRPAFHVRNLGSSTVQNLAHLGHPGAQGDAIRLRSGQTIPGIAERIPQFKAKGLTDEQATKELRRLAFIHQAFGKGMAPSREAERVAGGARMLADQVPGATPTPGLWESVKSWVPWKVIDPQQATLTSPFKGSDINPFNLFHPERSKPALGGRMLGDLVDDMTRGGGFITAMEQGYVPEAAKAVTDAAHFNYGKNLTQFERDWIRPLVPFYSYQKAIAQQVPKHLYEQPGGLFGTGIKVSGDLRQQEGFLPPYLGGGLATPLGQEDETGTRRYLTKLDLPWEQPFELFSTGPGGLSKTMMKGMGQLNPLLKAPLEVATNRQFYSGREMDDLYSQTGEPLADQVLMNLPTQPAAVALRTFMDPRKDWLATLLNLGTGVRVSDVNVKQQRAAAINELREMLSKDPEKIKKFESISVRPEALGTLTPDEIESLRLIRSLERKNLEDKKRQPPVPF